MRATALTVAAALALAGCGSDGSDRGGRADGPDATAPVFAPEGEALGRGLVVPEGARLAGAVFHERPPWERFGPPEVLATVPPPATVTGPGGSGAGVPSSSPTTASTTTTSTTTTTAPVDPDVPDDLTALLAVDGDPFTVWDVFAAQVREVGPALAGSADACVWFVRPPPDDPTLPGPYPAADGEPAEPIVFLRCRAAASEGDLDVAATLTVGTDRPASLLVEVRSPNQPEPRSYGEAAWVRATAAEGRGEEVSAATSPYDVVPTADTVPAAVHDLVPPAPPGDDAGPGEPFGGEGNCLAVGYDRLRLPAVAEVVWSEEGGDGTTVLATDDADAAIDGLLASAAAGDDHDSFVAHDPVEQTLADGSTTVLQGWEISAGGGACNVRTSPDGGFLLVRMHSD